MGEVINLFKTTTLDIPPDRVLQSAVGELDMVVVIGIKPDETMYLASSTSDLPSILWLLEKLKSEILSQG